MVFDAEYVELERVMVLSSPIHVGGTPDPQAGGDLYLGEEAVVALIGVVFSADDVAALHAADIVSGGRTHTVRVLTL
jgi:hypothetical protein